MRSKTALAVATMMLMLSFIGTSQGGLVMALVDKCKSNPVGVHAKIHAKVQDWKYAHAAKPKLLKRGQAAQCCH